MSHPTDMRAARIAVLAMFFINGAAWANWVSRIPVFQERFNFSEGDLGAVLGGNAIGIFAGLIVSSGLIQRFGSRRVTIYGAVLGISTLPALALMPSPIALFINLFFFGFSHSVMDIAMNGQGAEVELRAGKAMMSSFHATWSIGGVAGAGFGALMAALDIAPLGHFALVALISTLLLLRTAPNLLRDESAAIQETGSVLQIPPKVLWPLGIVVCLATFGEAAVASWSTVYLNSVVLSDETTAALGYAVFMLAMTVGRLSGDWLSNRYPGPLLLRAGGLLAALGVLLAVWQPYVLPTLIGFAAAGAGISFMVPLSFSAAGRMPGFGTGIAIAGVATIGYVGFLSAPSITGWIAEGITLQGAMLVVAGALALLIFMARALRVPESEKVAAGD